MSDKMKEAIQEALKQAYYMGLTFNCDTLHHNTIVRMAKEYAEENVDEVIQALTSKEEGCKWSVKDHNRSIAHMGFCHDCYSIDMKHQSPQPEEGIKPNGISFPIKVKRNNSGIGGFELVDSNGMELMKVDSRYFGLWIAKLLNQLTERP